MPMKKAMPGGKVHANSSKKKMMYGGMMHKKKK